MHPPLLVRVVRDGRVESAHRGAVVIAATDGGLLAAVGDAALPVYVRSAAKPFQALAVLGLLREVGLSLGPREMAIASASHDGNDDHQIEAAHLLARADLDERALRCPAALPADLRTLLDQRDPTPLAHNCSGKHAAFLLAQVASGAAPSRYLDPGTPLQERIADVLASVTGAAPQGPGVDGCGAPAWVLPLSALATGFARLAAGLDGLAPVRAALRAHPFLVGGDHAVDSALMRGGRGIVAKRGAEAVLAAGLTTAPGEAVGVAVKIEDGSARAAGPVVAMALAALGGTVPDAVRVPAVLGGGQPHGALEVDPLVAEVLAKVYGVGNRG